MLAVITSLVFTACMEPDDPDGVFHDYIPPVAALNITVINNTESPIQVKVRHYYHFFEYSWTGDHTNTTCYSDWVSVYLETGEQNFLGTETISFINDAGELQEMSGFLLMQREQLPPPPYGHIVITSSIEFSISTADTEILLAGYKTENIDFDANELCYLIVDGGPFGRASWMETIQQKISFFIEPFVLPVTLIIHADGTYTFSHEPQETGEYMTVWNK